MNDRQTTHNYAGRLAYQTEAMIYNPRYRYVREALYEVMKKKGGYTRFFNREKIDTPFVDAPRPDMEISFVDYKTYHELTTAARLFTFVGLTPRSLSHYNISFLSGVPSDFIPFTDEELEGYGDDEELGETIDPSFQYGWLLFGANREIAMMAKISLANDALIPLPDQTIRGMYGNDSVLEYVGQYRGEEDGYEYISDMTDFLYDPDEESYLYSKDYTNFLIDFDEMKLDGDDENEEAAFTYQVPFTDEDHPIFEESENTAASMSEDEFIRRLIPDQDE